MPRFQVLCSTLLLVASALLANSALARSVALPDSLKNKWQEARSDESLPYDVKTWINKVLRKDYEDAAHQWAVIQPQIPAAHQPLAQGTYLFLLYNLELPQTFVDAYLKSLLDPRFAKSQTAKDLEASMGQDFDELIAKHVVIFTPEQQTLVPKLPPTGMGLDLQAWAYLRKADQAQALLPKLPADHRLRDYLERAVALNLVRKGKIEDAQALYTGILQRASKDEDEGSAELQAAANLQLGRLAYQLADLKQAETYYEKIPKESESFLPAQEELMWIWLRSTNSSKLRGSLQSFHSSSLKDRLMSEFYVVRAISNLKLCFFDAAKADFDSFMTYNSSWAEKIDTAMKTNEPEAPPQPDWYTKLVEKAEGQLAAEIKILDDLKVKSITASLPSVGEQKHWKEASAALSQRVILLNKLKFAEYRRQWRNYSVAMRESIRKMQFVKVELLSQIEGGKTSQVDSETAQKNEVAAKNSVKEEANGKMSFKFEGVLWSDELFKLRSTAPNVCL